MVSISTRVSYLAFLHVAFFSVLSVWVKQSSHSVSGGSPDCREGCTCVCVCERCLMHGLAALRHINLSVIFFVIQGMNNRKHIVETRSNTSFNTLNTVVLKTKHFVFS